MFKKPNCPIIAIEEHYWDPELAKHFTGPEAGRGNETDERLYDLGALRIKEMDEAGIDVQVLSHGAPAAQKLGSRSPPTSRARSTTAWPRCARPTRNASQRSRRCPPSIRRPPPTSSSARDQARLQGRHVAWHD